MGNTAVTPADKAVPAPAPAEREWSPSAVDQKDIQGLVVSAYPSMRFARTLLVQFVSKDPAVATDAKGWITDITPRITYATGKVNPSINIAFSAAGLTAIKIDTEVLTTFSIPFQQGMTVATRSKFLGDVDGQDPSKWLWSDCTTDARGIHAQLMLFAEDRDSLDRLFATESASLARFGLSAPIDILQQVKLNANGMRREHFGFADGISQPTLIDGDAIAVKDRKLHEIAVGEVVLGHTNTYGRPAPGPFVSSASPAASVLQDGMQAQTKDLGMNGTYLVTRQLKQDVAAFWQNMQAASAGLQDESGKAATAKWLAEKAIGRTEAGYMLQVDRQEEANPVPPGQVPPNEMAFFDSDPDGYGCPVTSHVRRANPRDGLSPDKDDKALMVQASNRHRIIRRGRIYGEPIANPMVDDGVDRGLLFQCLNSEIDRQFEFVQHTWLLNKMFGGAYEQTDPLIGPKCPFSIPSRPVRQQPVLETFITAQGGGYFFVPSRSALQFFGRIK